MDVKHAADLYGQGRTLRQIGAELGVPWTSVGHQLRQAGVTRRRGGPAAHPASTQQILELRGQGLTWNEVAGQVDMTVSGAWSRYRRARPPKPLRLGRWQQVLADALEKNLAIGVRAAIVDHLGRAPTRAELTAARRAAHSLAASGRARVPRMLTEIGRPIPELGLRRIELGTRRVDLDDLLAICLVLGISVVDLLVPADLTDEIYQVTPWASATADHTREWIRGEQVPWVSIEDPNKDPEVPWASPAKHGPVEDFVRWMPEARKRRVLQWWLDMEKQDAWLMEHEEELMEQWIAEREQKKEEEDES